MKICNRCNSNKDFSGFSPDVRNKDGYQATCRQCKNEHLKKLRDMRKQGLGLKNAVDKVCTDCKQLKSISFFFKEAGCADGYNSRCKECKTKATMRWREKNKDAYNAGMRDYAKKHRRRIHYQQAYGMTVEQYDIMLAAQGGVCAIGGESPSGKRPLVIDHDHATGAVRQLLCYGCNRALHVLEAPELLSKAQAYLIKHKKAA